MLAAGCLGFAESDGGKDTYLVSVLVKGLSEGGLTVLKRSSLELELAKAIASFAGARPNAVHNLLMQSRSVSLLGASHQRQEKLWPYDCPARSPDSDYSLVSSMARLSESQIQKLADAWSSSGDRLEETIREEVGSIEGKVAIVCQKTVRFTEDQGKEALEVALQAEGEEEATTTTTTTTEKEKEKEEAKTTTTTTEKEEEKEASTTSRAHGRLDHVHFGMVVKGFDSELVGQSQLVFMESRVAHLIAEQTGLAPHDIQDLDGNPTSVGVDPGSRQVRQDFWSRTSETCSANEESNEAYTLITGKVPIDQKADEDAARKFSEGLRSKELQRNVIRVIHEQLEDSGSGAITSDLQMCAASDQHVEVPTTSTATTATETTVTTNTFKGTHPLVLQGFEGNPTAPPALQAAKDAGLQPPKQSEFFPKLGKVKLAATALKEKVLEGANEIMVDSTDGFSVGDEVRIANIEEEYHEDRIVTSLGSIVLNKALENEYPPGSTVSKLGGESTESTSPQHLPGPTFSTTITTTLLTQEVYVFSEDNCHTCLMGDIVGERLWRTSTHKDCTVFNLHEQSFKSLDDPDQCLDLFHNWGSRGFGLFECQGSDNQLFTQESNREWCTTKSRTRKCLQSCEVGATTTSTTIRFLGIKMPSVNTSWWDVRKPSFRVGKLTFFLGAMVVCVAGVCLIATCCRAQQESAAKRVQHQFHRDHYYSQGGGHGLYHGFRDGRVGIEMGTEGGIDRLLGDGS